MKIKAIIILLTVVFLASPSLASYIDVPEDHYAREAIDELVEVGILPPGEGRWFYGETTINRYLLTDFITKIIERILVGEKEELKLANSARGYRDVSPTNFAYRSIQKLIALGVLPPGDGRELFYGDRKISRYQMVYFTFSAIEYVLSDVVIFDAADPAFGYEDVPTNHFVYKTIQKLIWLGVLEGGLNRRFSGDEYVDRYELCYFTVNLIKAIYLKIEELREPVYEKPVEYGFKTISSTRISATQIANGISAGKDLLDVYGQQTVTISVERNLKGILSAFASFSSGYYFGDTLKSSSSSVSSAYVLFYDLPVVLQIGRTAFYQGFTPFGNSLFIDTAASDMILGYYGHEFFNLTSGIGKLVYLGDVYQDANFGFVSLSPKLPAYLDWLDILAGGSFISDLPDPSFTAVLPTGVVQGYGGLKMNLFNLFEFTAEMAKVDFSDKSMLPLVGYSTKEGFEASQYSLTYYSKDYGFNLSLGYQKIGDDYYLSTLADPTVFLGTKYDSVYLKTGQDTESYMVSARFVLSYRETAGADLVYVLREGDNFMSGLSGYYKFKLFDTSYINLSLIKIMDNTSAGQDELNLTSSFSISF